MVGNEKVSQVYDSKFISAYRKITYEIKFKFWTHFINYPWVVGGEWVDWKMRNFQVTRINFWTCGLANCKFYVYINIYFKLNKTKGKYIEEIITNYGYDTGVCGLDKLSFPRLNLVATPSLIDCEICIIPNIGGDLLKFFEG